jgi:hypothetical protein
MGRRNGTVAEGTGSLQLLDVQGVEETEAEQGREQGETGGLAMNLSQLLWDGEEKPIWAGLFRRKKKAKRAKPAPPPAPPAPPKPETPEPTYDIKLYWTTDTREQKTFVTAMVRFVQKAWFLNGKNEWFLETDGGASGLVWKSTVEIIPDSDNGDGNNENDYTVNGTIENLLSKAERMVTHHRRFRQMKEAEWDDRHQHPRVIIYGRGE